MYMIREPGAVDNPGRNRLVKFVHHKRTNLRTCEPVGCRFLDITDFQITIITNITRW